MKQNKTIIAITGGIGSGKSLVRHLLAEKGYNCYDCDAINAELLQSNAYLMGLHKLFPACFEAGVLRKDLLKQEIFRSEKSRQKLNAYAHAAIKDELIKRINASKETLLFVEVPILNDTTDDFVSLFDKIWIVYCNKNKRALRVLERDTDNATLLDRIMLSQEKERSYEKPVSMIKNEGTIEDLSANVEQELNRIKKGV